MSNFKLRTKKYSLFAFSIILLIGLYFCARYFQPKELVSHFIDVGEGDSTFIELPNGETMLIDFGEAEYAYTVVDYIKELGYNEIDYIVATHPHSDHIGGMVKVIDCFNVNDIYMTSQTTNTETFSNLLTTTIEKGLKVKSAKIGVNILTDKDLSVDILAPDDTTYSNDNDFSVVILIKYKNNKFLYMGDAGYESENKIVGDIRADVIKVGHHGSETSSSIDFIKRVQAKYAVVSVGADNMYGFPYDSVIRNWENSRASVYRTDNDGTIVITSDGKDISVSVSKE